MYYRCYLCNSVFLFQNNESVYHLDTIVLALGFPDPKVKVGAILILVVRRVTHDARVEQEHLPAREACRLSVLKGALLLVLKMHYNVIVNAKRS